MPQPLTYAEFEEYQHEQERMRAKHAEQVLAFLCKQSIISTPDLLWCDPFATTQQDRLDSLIAAISARIEATAYDEYLANLRIKQAEHPALDIAF